MALPTSIVGWVGSTDYIYGNRPFLSSGGNVYVILRSASTTLTPYKATDPTSSFSAQTGDTYQSAGFIGIVQDGDNLHIVTAQNTIVEYHVWSMSSDTWTVSQESVATGSDTAEGPGAAAIAVRSDGDVIVSYQGNTDKIMGTDWQRVDYARRESASWTSDIEVSNGGETHWNNSSAQLGSSDRVHFLFRDTTNGDLYQRTLTSGNSLETFPSAFYTAAATVQFVTEAFDDGGTTKVRATSGYLTTKFDSADAPTVTTDVETIPDTGFPSGFASAHDGTDYYAVWMYPTLFNTDSTYDIYDEGASSWGTDVVHRSITTGGLSSPWEVNGANYYQRSGTDYIAFVYKNADDSTWYYDEIDVTPAGGATAYPLSPIFNSGIGPLRGSGLHEIETGVSY